VSVNNVNDMNVNDVNVNVNDVNVFTSFGVSFVGTALKNINVTSETQRAVALQRSSTKKSR
jgi:hypothetical protein